MGGDLPSSCATRNVLRPQTEGQRAFMANEPFTMMSHPILSWTFSVCPLLLSTGAFGQPNAPPTVAAACAPCHGLDGIGHDVEIPNIAGQHIVYLREQLLAFKAGKRKHAEMQYIGRHLTDQEINELALYYSTLPHR